MDSREMFEERDMFEMLQKDREQQNELAQPQENHYYSDDDDEI